MNVKLTASTFSKAIKSLVRLLTPAIRTSTKVEALTVHLCANGDDGGSLEITAAVEADICRRVIHAEVQVEESGTVRVDGTRLAKLMFADDEVVLYSQGNMLHVESGNRYRIMQVESNLPTIKPVKFQAVLPSEILREGLRAMRGKDEKAKDDDTPDVKTIEIAFDDDQVVLATRTMEYTRGSYYRELANDDDELWDGDGGGEFVHALNTLTLMSREVAIGNYVSISYSDKLVVFASKTECETVEYRIRAMLKTSGAASAITRGIEDNVHALIHAERSDMTAVVRAASALSPDALLRLKLGTDHVDIEQHTDDGEEFTGEFDATIESADGRPWSRTVCTKPNVLQACLDGLPRSAQSITVVCQGNAYAIKYEADDGKVRVIQCSLCDVDLSAEDVLAEGYDLT